MTRGRNPEPNHATKPTHAARVTFTKPPPPHAHPRSWQQHEMLKCPSDPRVPLFEKLGAQPCWFYSFIKHCQLLHFPPTFFDASPINKQPFTLKFILVITVTVNIKQLLHSCTFINALCCSCGASSVFCTNLSQNRQMKASNKHFLKSKGGGSVSEVSRMINLMHPNKWD